VWTFYSTPNNTSPLFQMNSEHEFVLSEDIFPNNSAIVYDSTYKINNNNNKIVLKYDRIGLRTGLF
jgi:hypothetical protein